MKGVEKVSTENNVTSESTSQLTKEEIIAYLNRHHRNIIVNEILAVNKIFSKFELFFGILFGIFFEILSFSIADLVDLSGLVFLGGTVITIVIEIFLFKVLFRARRLKYFIKAENLILLEEIKTNKKQQWN